MAQGRIDDEIDRLYQLPPEAFTAARNALAKQAGAHAPQVRGLAKPPVAAWAVNQLFWNRRSVYDALIGASEEVRRTHAAVLGGKRGDLRTVGKTHEQAVDAALKATLAIMAESGHPATDATRQSVVTTLRAVPVDGERPGRLSRILQPGGFEMLTGLSISGAPRTRRAAEGQSRAAGHSPATRKQKAAAAKAPAARPRDLKALARARDASARAARELREAEHVARRQEFEAARAAREAEKAAGQIEIAREALEAAKQALAEAEAAAASSARARDGAERRSSEAERALQAARARADTAAAALAGLTD